MKPIIMSAESVRAILGGRKTQTRRVVKPQPPVDATDVLVWEAPELPASVKAAEGLYCHCPDGLRFLGSCPYPIGSRLWVRERFYAQPGLAPLTEPQPIHYALDVPDRRQVEDYRLHPSIHMPRWASRITLEVTGVRAERLQDITHNDICMEGWDPIWSRPFGNGTAGDDARAWYAALWDRINARRGLANQNGDIAWLDWASNPWVWVVEFRRGA